MNNFINLTGQKFGRLRVKERVENRGKHVYWKCECECGNITEVYGYSLRRGVTRSCGCLNKEIVKKTHIKHGNNCRRLRTPEYGIYHAMIKRCYNYHDSSYKNYGSRGITVCDRWLDKEHGFENFLEDMGKRPGKGYSIDRIDNNGNYCPENCRWATRKEQNNNARNNHYITYNGKTQSLALWCDELGVDYQLINLRLWRHWSFEKAILTPKRVW